MLDSPCHNCKVREFECHGKCESYKKYKDECKEISKKIKHESIVRSFGIRSELIKRYKNYG